MRNGISVEGGRRCSGELFLFSETFGNDLLPTHSILPSLIFSSISLPLLTYDHGCHSEDRENGLLKTVSMGFPQTFLSKE